MSSLPDFCDNQGLWGQWLGSRVAPPPHPLLCVAQVSRAASCPVAVVQTTLSAWGYLASTTFRSQLQLDFLSEVSLPQSRPVYVSTWHHTTWAPFFRALCHNLLICVYHCDSLVHNGHPHLTVSFTKAESWCILFVFL